MIACLSWGRIDLVVKTWRNRQFACNPPRVTDEQHEAVGVRINSGRVVERCLGGIHLFHEETRDGAASDAVETGWLTGKIEVSRLTAEKDGIVPR